VLAKLNACNSNLGQIKMDGDWVEDIFGGVSFQFHDNCGCCPDRDLFLAPKRRRRLQVSAPELGPEVANPVRAALEPSEASEAKKPTEASEAKKPSEAAQLGAAAAAADRAPLPTKDEVAGNDGPSTTIPRKLNNSVPSLGNPNNDIVKERPATIPSEGREIDTTKSFKGAEPAPSLLAAPPPSSSSLSPRATSEVPVLSNASTTKHGLGLM